MPDRDFERAVYFGCAFIFSYLRRFFLPWQTKDKRGRTTGSSHSGETVFSGISLAGKANSGVTKFG